MRTSNFQLQWNLEINPKLPKRDLDEVTNLDQARELLQKFMLNKKLDNTKNT